MSDVKKLCKEKGFDVVKDMLNNLPELRQEKKDTVQKMLLFYKEYRKLEKEFMKYIRLPKKRFHKVDFIEHIITKHLNHEWCLAQDTGEGGGKLDVLLVRDISRKDEYNFLGIDSYDRESFTSKDDKYTIFYIRQHVLNGYGDGEEYEGKMLILRNDKINEAMADEFIKLDESQYYYL